MDYTSQNLFVSEFFVPQSGQNFGIDSLESKIQSLHTMNLLKIFLCIRTQFHTRSLYGDLIDPKGGIGWFYVLEKLHSQRFLAGKSHFF